MKNLNVLIITASRQGEALPIISVTVYGATLVLLYVFSTLNHSLQGAAKKVFQKLDFLAIYLLIAGTYTPFALITLRGAGGWVIFGLVWGLAILGICLELLPHKSNRFVSLIFYLIMGWVILIAIRPLIQTLGVAGFSLLLTHMYLLPSAFIEPGAIMYPPLALISKPGPTILAEHFKLLTFLKYK